MGIFFPFKIHSRFQQKSQGKRVKNVNFFKASLIFIGNIQLTLKIYILRPFHNRYFSFSYINIENEPTTLVHWGSNIPVNCETESTEYPSSQCIFPYEYKGKTYYECVKGVFGYDFDDNFWCPTVLDPDNQPYNWGRCGENCPSSNLRDQGYRTSTIIPRFASKFFSEWPVIRVFQDTSILFDKGNKEIVKKIAEEANELAISTISNDGRILEEAADLIYHLQVLLIENNLSLKELENILKMRNK